MFNMMPILMKRIKSQRQDREKLRNGNIPQFECCRTCLSVENLNNIFNSKALIIKRMQQLELITGLQIKYNDGLSQKMCTRCLAMMKNALHFRLISFKAQKSLLEIRQKYNNSEDNKHVMKIERNNDNLNQEIDESNKSINDNVSRKDVNKSSCLLHKISNSIKRPMKRKRLFIPDAGSYTCPVCNIVLTRKPSFLQHLRYHYHPQVCEMCGKQCRSKSSLQSHKQAMHGFDKIFKCKQCDKSFAYKDAYRIHVRTHTGEKPYICDICGARFHRRGTFVQHLGVHNPENTVQCELCPARVKSIKFLHAHKNRVHSGRRYRYICPICDRQFRIPANVRKHAWKVHEVAENDLGTIVRINTFLQDP
ncbi:zinc finger protein 287-like isoform X3 [Pieris napi]|uniref:zinc finger protein 287-like isoform X3 n=1 Tax=Pieris napi TaxID=78633 RepID=UPI001FB87ED0|nr:zinc finger protein 287-like isoform X3 [Pieris napi]